MALEYLRAVEARRRRRGDDQSRINRWLSAFGDQDASSTTTIRQIEKVLTDLENETMQPATMVCHITVLKAAFNRAKRLA
jgi:hypothetical protein